jgi:predicted nucleic acid-binding protein
MASVRSWHNRLNVADTSFWISLIAGGRAIEIARAFDTLLHIPRIALGELERGREKGRQTAAAISELIRLGLVTVTELPATAEETYYSLIAGSARDTLGDGEAATLAIAIETGAVAIIDERKAISIAESRFPNLEIMTMTDLLLSDVLVSRLGKDEISNVLYAALQGARMRVPNRLLGMVCDLLGTERSSECHSLPASARRHMTESLIKD